MGGSCSNNLTSGMREVEDVPCQHQQVANYRVARTMSCMGDDEAAREAGTLEAMLADFASPTWVLQPGPRSVGPLPSVQEKGECISGEGRIGCGEEVGWVRPRARRLVISRFVG